MRAKELECAIFNVHQNHFGTAKLGKSLTKKIQIIGTRNTYNLL
jgi:hypothetical protein